MPYYTKEQWDDMSEDGRKAVVEIAYAKFDEEHPTHGSAAYDLIASKIHALNAEPDEQLGILDLLFGLFNVKR